MDYGLLFQHVDSDWQGCSGSIFGRDEWPRQYVVPDLFFLALSPHSPAFFPRADPKIRRSLIIVAAFNIVINIPQVILAWFQCTPPSALWDPLRQNQCNHTTAVHYTYFVGAVAALSDFYLAIVPVTMLAPLQIDRKLKWGLSFLMGCGVFAGAAAIVRTWATKFIMSGDSSCGFTLSL